MNQNIFGDDKTKCYGCEGCVEVCPRAAITMEEDKEGFRYPVVNEEKCVDCGLCTKSYPEINPPASSNGYLTFYGTYHKIRDLSTSGGIQQHSWFLEKREFCCIWSRVQWTSNSAHRPF